MSKAREPTVLDLFRAIRDSESTKGSQRILLLALALRCKPGTWMCWPSYSRLARDTCLDAVTCKRAAKGLEEAGIVRRQVRRNRSNRFYINFERLRAQAETRSAVRDDLEDSVAAPQGGAADPHENDNDSNDPLFGWGQE